MRFRFQYLSRAAFIAPALFAIAMSAGTASATPYGQLDVAGQRGEFVTEGGSYHITGGQWTGVASDIDTDGDCDLIQVKVDGLSAQQQERWIIDINSFRSGLPLNVGAYDVPRESEAISFLIGASSRASGVTDGTFTIHELETAPWQGNYLHLIRLSLSFSMTSGGRNVTGTLRYVDDGSPIPGSFPQIARAKYSRSKHTVKITGIDFEPGASVIVDATQVLTVKKITPKSIKTIDVTLPVGIRTLVVRNADGGESPPFELAIFSSAAANDDASEPEDDDDQE